MLIQRHLFPVLLALSLQVTDRTPLDHDHALALRFICTVIPDRLPQRRTEGRLILLCKLSADSGAPVAQRLIKLPQRPQQMMGSLVKYNCPGLRFQFFQDPLLFLFIHGQKRFKTKSSGTQPGYR